jgi:hypothetical protein
MSTESSLSTAEPQSSRKILIERLILFDEFYHDDKGAGLRASHQTGWIALVAVRIEDWKR